MVVISELLQEFSSSSTTHGHLIYDVFLSFRGLDTRLNFTDHLYKMLTISNFTTFLDDEEIETGEDLKPELENAIKASRASIIVLSKNYASSTWCLDELVMILEQRRNSNQIVVPIFHHVEPTDVRKQQNSFGIAMAKHKQRMESETNVEEKGRLCNKIEIWEKALTEVSNLKGMDSKGRQETKFIDEIVKDIYQRLGVLLRTTSMPILYGREYSINCITSWLNDRSLNTVDIFTIFGLGGIGKTSLARHVHELHRRMFDRSSFIEGVNEKCTQQVNGLLDLQKQLCDDISKSSPIQIHDVFTYTSMIENALSRQKVFIVLDDIDSLEQLYALLGKKGFHPGSKVIITTKNMSLAEKYAPIDSLVQPKHTKHHLLGLNAEESLKLLSYHAFRVIDPKEGYEEVSEKLLAYCQGHPLALKVLGESLYNRDVVEWEECIEELKVEPISRVQKALQVSFNSMSSNNDKELFKHIACFFVGEDRKYTEIILTACGIRTQYGITNLINKCLLTIGPSNVLRMHQLLQEMGRDVVRQESPDKPWKRSRLWCHEESFNVLEQNKGTGKLKGLVLDMKMLEEKKLCGSVELNVDALSKIRNLMLLQLNYVQLNGSYKNFPKSLRWLCMHGFPLKSIPLDLPMENLVALDMSYSNFESFDMSFGNPLQPGKRPKLKSLKVLNLSFCKLLRSIRGFFEVPALERLILANCISLIEVCESIEHCIGLVLIDLRNCIMLRELPRTMVKLNKVETLLVDGCNLDELQEMLNANNIGINSQASTSTIVEAIPRAFKSFWINLPTSLVTLSLQDCKLSDTSFPEDFNWLPTLKILKLDRNPIRSMPNCVRSLPKLEILSMQGCRFLTSVVHPPRTLTEISLGVLYHLHSIVFVQEMSPLFIGLTMVSTTSPSFGIEGVVNVQLMAHVKEEVFHSLGWTNLEFVKNQRIKMFDAMRNSKSTRVQMFFEFGIFSTIYWGKEIPNWFSERSKGSSISFTIPSSHYNLRGINFCYVQSFQGQKRPMAMQMIRISNITKNRTWIYNHFTFKVLAREEYLTSLSHWMMGKNEMENGDQLTITLLTKNKRGGLRWDDGVIMECGVSLVYDEDDDDVGKNEMKEEEEDALGYYKSWNHIIGGDLSAFQITTGEYILQHMHFRGDIGLDSYYHPYVAREACYKGEVNFTAFSKGKPSEQILKTQMEMIEQRKEQARQERRKRVKQSRVQQAVHGRRKRVKQSLRQEDMREQGERLEQVPEQEFNEQIKTLESLPPK